MNDWYWVITVPRGDFFITILGDLSQEEAAKKVHKVFEMLDMVVIGMIPRKRETGPDTARATIMIDPKTGKRTFMAASGIWQLAGRGVEYEAKLEALKEKQT